jgi:hypothetical protein
MYQTSARFRESVIGTHRTVVRLRLIPAAAVPLFGADPDGIELPLIGDSADVRLNSTSDVKASISVTVPGDYWDQVAPYGAELFAERGIDFGDGTREYVPLGYYRINKRIQSRSPYGPVQLEGENRTAQLLQTRVIYPYQVPVGTSHRTLFNYLVNGVASGSGTYGMWTYRDVPIDWTDAGYDPDAAILNTGTVVDDSVYDFLAKLADSRGAVIDFAPTGEMVLRRRDPDLNSPADFVIREGKTGTLVQASRSESRDGVYNMVRATGSDPAYQTGYRLAWLSGPSPLRWDGPFGPVVRYYASPVLETSDQADAAAETILSRTTGLPTELSLWTVPDPSIQALDVAQVITAGTPLASHVIDEVTIPLLGSAPVQLRTRTLNVVLENPTDPEPEQPEEPEEPGNPGNPDPGGPTTPGGGSSEDGTQAALLNGWGAVIAGDEFNYSGRPDPAKWGLYDGPGHGGNGRRSPSAFSVHDGMMTIHGENKVSGGTAFTHRRGDRRYRVEARCRVYNTGGGSDRYHPVLILWPDNDVWPEGAEYDFMECDEGTGQFGLYMHLPNHQPYRQDYYGEALDLQNWHNYACEWDGPGRTLKAWIDGRLVYSATGRVAEAPGPMHFTFQLDDFGGNPRPCNFDMAWVRIYGGP